MQSTKKFELDKEVLLKLNLYHFFNSKIVNMTILFSSQNFFETKCQIVTLQKFYIIENNPFTF